MNPIAVPDRIDINDLLVNYCHAIDDKRWEDLAALFAADATIDMRAYQGPFGTAAQIIEFLQATTLQVPRWQHTISTSLLTPSGADMKARTAAQVMMIQPRPDQTDQVTFIGLWYEDLLTRTDSGWKFQTRVQCYGWVSNSPA